ncbi:MAG: glutathione peroxidase [Saprospiraceae bacterium]|jgi:glutathione peroxidase|nr:glutathione peroxidase [Saprospiraceae bacterium]MBL0026654.1 glutathione peroxidase [Saprospiraceae bacterium]
MSTLYSVQVKDIKGKDLDLHQFKGKKLMIVNVASECGFTQQYAQLEELYNTYKDSLAILGCPCNEFGNQEPGDENDIQQFCTINFGVTFPLTQKISIISNPHPLYDWLCLEVNNGIRDFEVKWNFYKFLIQPDGSLYRCLSSLIEPMDDKVLEWVKVGYDN